MKKENFYLENNEDRYKEYLFKYLFKYLNKYNIYNYIYERNLIDESYSGIFINNKNIVSCIIPKRKTLYDEMICIHELTRLVNILSTDKNVDSVFNEIIPYFNEYNYLKLINDNLAFAYEDLRYCQLNKKEIENSNFINHLYAYSALVRRKNDYDIDELNRINSNDVDLTKELKLTGYIK